MAHEERITLQASVDVVLEEEDGHWGAYVPALPGCIAVAESRTEIARLIEEAIAFHLEGLACEAGRTEASGRVERLRTSPQKR